MMKEDKSLPELIGRLPHTEHISQAVAQDGDTAAQSL
jgi:hypothetical protein